MNTKDFYFLFYIFLCNYGKCIYGKSIIANVTEDLAKT